MKLLKLLVLSAMVLMATVGASNGAPASVLTAVPGEPGPIYPTNNELIYTYGASQLEFQWSSAGTLGTVYYDVQVSTDPTFTNSSAIVSSNLISGTHSNCGTSNQAPNWVSPYAYQPATTYYWRIQAYDGTCNGDFVTGGSGWAVYTFYTAISAPTLVSPLSGTLSDNLNNDPSTTPPHPFPLFQWTPVSGASGYILEVATDAMFNSLYLDVSVPYSNTFNGGAAVGYTLSSDLPAGTLFYWRVETLNSTYGPSGWSSAPAACVSGYCSFYSANVSAAPVPISNPEIGSRIYRNAKVTTDFTPGLSWNEVALPSGSTFFSYEVEVSTDNTFTDATQTCFDVGHTLVGYLANQTYNNDGTLTYAQLDTQNALAAAAPGPNCPTQNPSGTKLEFMPATAYYWRVRAYF